MVPSSAQSSERKVRVLVIDDSALVRKVVKTILQQDPDIEVVGVAADPTWHARRSSSCSPMS